MPMPLLAGVAPPFLTEVVALLVVSVLIAYLCYRVRLVPIAGFLLAGVLIGPGAFGLVRDRALVDSLAEVGVILLLFSIGVEFSLEKLAKLGRAIFVGGGLQVGLTVLAAAAVLILFGVAWNAAVFTGCLVALSSTAIVLTLLADRSETETPVGQLALAILIFQDFAIILMVLMLPLLGGQSGTPLHALEVLGRALLVVAVVVVGARRVVPFLLEKIVRTRRQELFLLAVVAICFGTAWIVSLAGVSVALGAFLAGLVVSESHYSEQALSEIIPLRTVFNAVFFVSVGMLLDLWFVVENIGLVLAVAAGVLVLKFVLTSASVLALRYPVRIAAATGLGLAQIGEFSFVLERAGQAEGLLAAGLAEGGQFFIAVSVVLMLLTPLLVAWGPKAGNVLGGTRLGRFGRVPVPAEGGPALEDHVVIVGYGPAGERLVRVLHETKIPYSIIELNPDSVLKKHAQGAHAVFGDATRPHILEAAGLHRAKLCVVVINDHAAAGQITRLAHELNPTLQILVRTRYISEVEGLQRAGADIVVPEELETSVRIFSQVLGAYMVPPDVIEEQVRSIREGDYRIFRGSIQEAHLMVLQGLDEEGLHTRAVLIRDGAPVEGRSLAELELRQRHHLTVLAVRRAGRTHGSPAGDFRVAPGDRLVLIGVASDFARCADLFRARKAEDP